MCFNEGRRQSLAFERTIMDTEKNNNTAGLLVATPIMGAVVGLSSGLLSKWLDLVESFFLHFRENDLMPVATGTSAQRRLLAVTIGAIIAAVIWFWMQRHYRPVKLKKAVAGQMMPFCQTILHVLTQIFYVGTGGSIGRELAPREAGAMLAQHWEQLVDRHPHWRLSGDDRRLLVAAAAGAGFAGVYIAPITGAMFCLEILYQKVSKRAVAVSFTMSAIATLVGGLFKGWQPYYYISQDAKFFPHQILPLLILLAPLLGISGTLFRQALQQVSARRAVDWHVLIQLPLVGLLTGLVATFFPQIAGNGRGVAQLAMNTSHVSRLTIALLLFGFLAKLVVTLLTIKGGAYGGVLTPSIALGSTAGVLLGMLYGLVVPGVNLTQCALVGAVAFLAASQQAPLMALFMLFEVCHLDFSALLPFCIAAGLSIATSRWLLSRLDK